MEMIPKVIHYCWFGGGPLNQLSETCMASWKKFCPDYKVVRWDESNYDVTKNNYMRQAYEAKKWAFVSDYARLDVIYEHGGIYLDTDIELLQPLDRLLDRKGFLGIESTTNMVNTGIGMGGEAGVELFRILRDEYDTMDFRAPDGKLKMAPCTYIQTETLKRLGYIPNDQEQQIDGVDIFSSSVLASGAWNYKDAHASKCAVAFHHGTRTWLDEEDREMAQKDRVFRMRFGKMGGELLSNGLRVWRYWRKHGIRATIEKWRAWTR